MASGLDSLIQGALPTTDETAATKVLVTTGSATPAAENHTGTAEASNHGELQQLCFPDSLDLVFALQHHSIEQDSGESIDSLQAISRASRVDLVEVTASRTGREMQRWSTVGDSTTPNCRLTAGCVPILSDGRVMLISSSKSDTVFVLPKGGWEQDESLAFAALRETLEEAGVTGLLGPPLPTFTYEKTCQEAIAPARSHCSLTLFPLYVQVVHKSWAEQNRRRRAVTLEQAIDLVQDRPEFRHMLVELRQRNLHCLLSPT